MSASVVTVVQARTGSTRLPGKVLRPAGGSAVLATQIRRMEGSRLAGRIVVAVTTDPSDDVLVEHCRVLGVDVVRGHPTDLLDRHLLAGRRFGADVVVKVPSDCPLIDPAVIDRVLSTHLGVGGGLDYTSNLHPPTWPDGQDVEAVSMEALEVAGAEATADFEREHTTPFIWERPDRFRLRNVTWDRDLFADYRLTIDYPEDLALVDAVLTHLPYDAPIEEIVSFLSEHPGIADLNAAYRGVNWYRHHLDRLRTVGVSDTRWAPGEMAR